MFIAFLLPLNTKAQTILYESYEDGGTVTLQNGGYTALPLVTTFEVFEPLLFNSLANSYIGFKARSTEATCGAGVPAFYISSSTDSTIDLSEAFFSWGTTTDLELLENFQFFSLGAHPGLPDNWLLPGHTYGVYGGGWCGIGNDIEVAMDPLNLIMFGYITWDGDYRDTFITNSGITRVISTDPTTTDPLTVLSTSSPEIIFADIFVHEDDYEPGLILRQTITIDNPAYGAFIAGGAITAVNQAIGAITIEYPILEAGYSQYSTTTQFDQIGKRTLKTSILDPAGKFLGITFGSDKTLTSTQEHFIVGTTTKGDMIQVGVQNEVEALLGESSGLDFTYCNPLSGAFSIPECITALIIPSQQSIDNLLGTARSTILEKAPIGYVTRFVDILNTEATTTFPVLGFTMKSGTPLEGEYEVDILAGLQEADTLLRDDWTTNNSLIDTTADQDIWDVFMPWIETIGYLGLFTLILKDVLGLSTHNKHLSIKNRGVLRDDPGHNLGH